MRILRYNIHKGQGFLSMIPQDDEDIWHLYNLISVGDFLKAKTTRKVTKEGSTGMK